MSKTHFPNAKQAIKSAIDKGILTDGMWGDGSEAVCMMSAMVSGADSTEACVTAGWPKWLAELNVSLFDADVGADDEGKARNQFALDVADAVSVPRDMDKALSLFLVARLEIGKHSALETLRGLDGDQTQQINAVETVVSLLKRRLTGEDVSAEMEAARAAARAAAYATAAAYAADAADAAYAAADAAYAAAYAADAAAYATNAADAYHAYAAAARAAARNDLIAALKAA